MEETKSDFSQDKGPDYIDEELLNAGEKIEKPAKKLKTIALSVIGIILLFGCWLGDKIIKESISTASVTQGKGEMVDGIDRMIKPNQGAEISFKNAIKSFEGAIKQNKSCSDAYFFLGVTYYHWYIYEKRIGTSDTNLLDDLSKKTESNLIKATKVKRNFPEAYIYLGAYYYLKEMNSKAAASLDTGRKTGEKIWKDKQKKKDKWLPYIESTKELIKNNTIVEAPPPLPDGIGL
ncbi:MAG: hypothetical protein ABRQ39_10875 [Candidatus Eremiobacterota bacterium]